MNEANSLVGMLAGDHVGGGNHMAGVTEIGPSHFVVSSPNWNGERGAATLVNSTTGMTGPVGPGNSLIGTTPLDGVSSGNREGVVVPVQGTIGHRDGTFLVYSPRYDSNEKVNAGAITVASIYSALTGTITAGNSFIGPPTDYGTLLSFDYDTVNRQLVVGRKLSNSVSVFTAAVALPPVRITGTVRTPGGAPLRNAVVTLTNGDGGIWRATTSSFGTFAFDGIPARRDYTVTVSSKRYRFTPRLISNVSADHTVGDLFGLE